MHDSCSLCFPQNENLVWQNDLLRVILVADDFYHCYFRIIIKKHVRELSDLSHNEAMIVFAVLYELDRQIKVVCVPDKINIASLGNMVPHLHWHIIPRYQNDRHFPNSIWGEVANNNYLPPRSLKELEKILIKHLPLALTTKIK